MKQAKPIFLQRTGYRRRRMMDAARLLPVAGAFLFLIPLLWSGPGGGPALTGHGIVYLFPIWLGLILLAAAISRRLQRPDVGAQDEVPGDLP